MNRTLGFILALLCLLAAVPGMAQTLQECQALAEANYPLAKRYGLIESAANYTVANIRKGWLPQVNISAQATYQSDVVTLPNALQNVLSAQGMNYEGLKKDQYRLAVDVQQTLYDGGAIAAQKDVARMESEVQKAQTAVDIYALRERVNNLYFGILLLEEKARVCDSGINLLEANLSKMESLLAEGVAMRSDVAMLRREVLEAKQQRIEIDCSAQAFSKMLALLCNKEIDPLLPENLAETNAPESRMITLFDRQESLLTLREKQLDAALRPKLSLFLQGFYGYPGMNMYEDMFSRAWSLNGLVGVRLNWNFSALYTRGNDKKRLATQREEIANARDTYLFNSNLLQTQEQQFISRSRLLLAEDDEIIALSREVRESAEAKLAEGIIDTFTLLQEITREQQAQIRRAEHEIEMHQHLAELKYIQGKRIKQ